MNCVFCAIAEGTVAADIVWQSEDAVAFLDHSPLFPGHVLLIPRNHYVTLADLPPEQIQTFFAAAQRIEVAVESLPDAQGSFIGVNNRVSQSVPHLHMHVVPRRKGDGLRGFFWPRRKYETQEHLREIASLLRSKLASA